MNKLLNKGLMEYKLDLKLAVLIDADNVPSSNMKGMMEEIAKYGFLEMLPTV